MQLVETLIERGEYADLAVADLVGCAYGDVVPVVVLEQARVEVDVAILGGEKLDLVGQREADLNRVDLGVATR
ncbi:MAG: hypothetical protein AAF328_07885 [Planctomycetota bacterium]